MMQPVLDYQNPQTKRPWNTGRWAVVAGAMVFVLVAISVAMPALNHSNSEDVRLHCRSNLRQIGIAFQLYAAENRGALAPDFATLIESEDLLPETFVCPATDDDRVETTQPSSILRRVFATPGHCSYIFVGGVAKLSGAEN